MLQQPPTLLAACLGLVRSIASPRPLTIIWLLFAAASSQAAVVILKGEASPVYGPIVRQDEKRVVVNVQDAGGKLREQSIPRESISEILTTVAPQRLAALDPTKPAVYREYAEELAAKRRDPEARAMAIRLYVVAASLDPARQGPSSLRGLVALARSPQEEQRFRGVAYILDPQQSLSAAKPATKEAAVDESAAQELIKALRLLRSGKGQQARTLAEKPEVVKLLEEYDRVFPKAEFNVAAGETPLSTGHLRHTLLLELALDSLAGPAENNSTTTRSLPWSRELQVQGTRPIGSLDLKTLTEFDPRECLFREGKWIERK